MTEVSQGWILAQGEGERFAGSTGATFILKAGAGETASGYSLIEGIVPAGIPSPGAHVHSQHEEGFYVLSGEMTVLLGERTVRAVAGSFVLVPRGTPHTYGNPSASEARCLVIGSPGGMEGLFEAFAKLAAASGDGRLDPKAVSELGLQYDTDYDFGGSQTTATS
jgi:quercetin dioxygenase-like cupin family protein